MVTAQETYSMLGQSALWETAHECHRLLSRLNIPHSLVGGVAVCLHGYQRNTIDVDLLIQPETASQVKQTLTAAGYQWDEANCQFLSPRKIPVQFLISETPAGAPGSGVRNANPADKHATEMIEQLPVVSLSRLIEMKIACGQDHVRRMHKDFADVVELIAAHRLGRDYARFLHKAVRKTFRDLVLKSRGDA